MAIRGSEVGRGLRVLLEFRVPEGQVEPSFQRIVDSVSANAPDGESELELARRVRQTMDAIAPRPREPMPQDPPPEALVRKILEAVAQCTPAEKEVLRQRYQKEQTFEEIADTLHIAEDQVRSVLRVVRRKATLKVK
jgi:DNA-directed RNA polymerase specialized sigma24 family protein